MVAEIGECTTVIVKVQQNGWKSWLLRLSLNHLERIDDAINGRSTEIFVQTSVGRRYGIFSPLVINPITRLCPLD
jgi:hypothetical protein